MHHTLPPSHTTHIHTYIQCTTHTYYTTPNMHHTHTAPHTYSTTRTPHTHNPITSYRAGSQNPATNQPKSYLQEPCPRSHVCLSQSECPWSPGWNRWIRLAQISENNSCQWMKEDIQLHHGDYDKMAMLEIKFTLKLTLLQKPHHFLMHTFW